MIDIHHHLLFGLDDGSPDLETSIAMAESAAEDGITHIVCTPHANAHYAFQPEVNRHRLAELRSRLNDQITLGLGCDFHLSYNNIVDAKANPSKYSINGNGYLLVEFAETNIPASINDAFRDLQQAGLAIILTHPERNPIIVQHPERLAEWVRMGCAVQVTASSLYGRFGKTAEAFSNELLHRNWIHFLATDAHNLTSRPPHLKPAYDYVVNKVGEKTANRICVDNPRAVFAGEPLPDQPEPLGLWDEKLDFGTSAAPQKKSFFGRFFSR
jgi:protein-tyrosine phosphatase